MRVVRLREAAQFDMIAKAAIWIVCLVPLGAAAFSMDVFNDQTHLGPGGRYGVSQCITHNSHAPNKVCTWICSGATGVWVPSIDYEIDDPKATGLRQLWALGCYATNSLPQVWLPPKTPRTTPEIGEFLHFNLQKDSASIPAFIERYGLPDRYLTGSWAKRQVLALGSNSAPFLPDDSLRGPDFLIYDLPSGHAVVLYVPKPPAVAFITSIIIDAKGNLLIPNMVELLLPQPPKLAPPRKLIAEPDGKITVPDASGGKETIGTWTMRDRQLIVTTTLRNGDAVLEHDSIWLGGVEYVPDIMVNEHEIICDLFAGRE
jgi:hypothetical protein